MQCFDVGKSFAELDEDRAVWSSLWGVRGASCSEIARFVKENDAAAGTWAGRQGSHAAQCFDGGKSFLGLGEDRAGWSSLWDGPGASCSGIARVVKENHAAAGTLAGAAT